MNQIQQAQLDKLAGRRSIASVSGGKDSTAMALWLKENDLHYEPVFLDTGWEAPETYEYLREVLPAFLGELRWLKPERQMEDLILHKGMFPSRVRRFCTQQLKVFPMQKYLATLEFEHVNAVGIRRAESKARSQTSEWEWSEGFDCEVWRPLVEWSFEDIVAIHKRHNCPPNPLYLKGADRVGCYPCIFARKSDVRQIAEAHPERIDQLRELERLVGQGAYERALKRGAPLTRPPTWFQARTGGTGDCWSIDKVVAWARTGRGGYQWELFEAPEEESGCMRWGLCETSSGETK